MKAELVKPGLYRIGGTAGQAFVRVGTKGVVVVDSTGASTHRALMAEIQRIAKTSDPSVRALVLTAAGRDQASTIGAFIDAGVPVIVQQRALAQLVRQGAATGASPAGSFITYENDYQLRLGEIEVEVEHVGSGRTGVDSIVVFRGLGVVAVGGLYTADAPQPDCASGGSFAGWAAAIDHLLWSDFDIAVPSRGAAVGKSELRAFKATLEALSRRAGSSPSGPADCRPRADR
jgi:glyoxylase-like metal-dependent hydrolase (beta-lactamase superfamily II)